VSLLRISIVDDQSDLLLGKEIYEPSQGLENLDRFCLNDDAFFVGP